MTLSQRIKQLRNKRNINLNELAQRSGIGKATLSRIESKKTLGTVGSLAKIAKAFQITVQELLEGAES